METKYSKRVFCKNTSFSKKKNVLKVLCTTHSNSCQYPLINYIRTDHVTRCNSFAQGTEAEENWVPTELAFVIIVLLLIGLSGGFSIYSLYHPRYTFKRVASALHLLTASMLIGMLIDTPPRVFQHLEEFESHRLKTAEAAAEAAAAVSAGAGGGNVQHYYGYSYLMAWITFIISILAFLAFFALSKKRKHSSHDLETQLK